MSRPAPYHGQSLTRREQQIAELVGEGLTNSQIAGKLYLSHFTVKSHLARMFVKIGVTSRASLAVATLGSRYLTTEQIVGVLRRTLATAEAENHQFCTVDYYRQQGTIHTLKSILDQIATTRETP